MYNNSAIAEKIAEIKTHIAETEKQIDLLETDENLQIALALMNMPVIVVVSNYRNKVSRLKARISEIEAFI